MADALRKRYAEALAAKFTEPRYRCDRYGENEWVENPEPSDRVDQSLTVRFIAGDGYPAFRTVTCNEAAEVCAAVRDEELERYRKRWRHAVEAADALTRRVADLERVAKVNGGLYRSAEDDVTAAEAAIARVQEATSQEPPLARFEATDRPSEYERGWAAAMAEVERALAALEEPQVAVMPPAKTRHP